MLKGFYSITLLWLIILRTAVKIGYYL